MASNADNTSDDPGGSLATPASFTQDTVASNLIESPSSVAEVPEPAEQHPCSSVASTDEVADAPEGSLKVQESLPPEAQSSPQPFPLPDWLLEHCVTLRETWKDTPDCLDLLGDEAFDKKTGMPTKAEVKRIKAQDLATMPHAMDETWFDGLLSLVRPEEQKLAGNSRFFTNDVVHIHSPILERLPTYRTRFLTCVVKQFAKTINADLVVLDEDDLKDFSEVCWDAEDLDETDYRAAKLFEQVNEAPHGAPETQDGDGEGQQAGSSTSVEAAVTSATRWNEPFAAILDATQIKRSRHPAPCGTSGTIPSIIFLSMDEPEIIESLVGNLRRVFTASSVSSHSIVLVAHIKFEDEDKDDDGLYYMECCDVKSVQLLPVRTRHMRSLLQADETAELRHKNARYLRRRIRHRKPHANKPPLSMPHAQWDFLEASQTNEILERQVLQDSTLVRGLLEYLGDSTSDNHIKTGVLSIGRRARALETWEYSSDSASDSDEDMSMKNEWSKFPEHAQKHLREISQGGSSTFMLRWILPLLVDPVEANEAIAVDEEIVKTLNQVVEHHQNPDAVGSSYGILKREQTGGALVYGPPGTGKTLMARALAARTSSVVISATIADIQSQYLGESPKVIQALFRLARLIAPSIVFIDEADAVFAMRSSSTSTFYRQTTNQLLTEMDGLRKSKNNPLVILATNLPTLIDPAVLRRVPNMVYLGLPSVTLREQIFRIVLKEEILESSIDMTRLAQMTRGYSGSDIKSLCYNAALMCDKFVETGEDKGKRLLTWQLFEQILTTAAGSRWTAVKHASRFVVEFAKRHDPAGYRKMLQDDAELDSSQIPLEQTTVADRTVEEVANSTTSRGDSNGTTVESEDEEEGEEEKEESATSPILGLATSSTHPVPILLNAPASATRSTTSGMLSFPYTPLPENSKTIRLVILHPSPDKKAQITGNLITVDLDDQTQPYKDFQSKLTEHLGHRSPVDRRLTRHFMWNLVNINPLELSEPRFSKAVHQVAESTSLYEFCDRPLELMRGLVDRYSWGDYLALSYVWGDPTKRQTILLDDIPFGVGDNLHAALFRLRSSYDITERGLKVWIDALCINQNDSHERSVEVQKMGLIYAEALVVRGWLGDCSSLYLRVDLSAIRRAWDLEADFLHRKDQGNPLKVLTKLDRGAPFPKQMEEIAQSDETFKTTIFQVNECLFNKKYWDRLWIVQEMAMASSLVFWYEQDSFFITPRECRSINLDPRFYFSRQIHLVFGTSQAAWNCFKHTRAHLRLGWLRESSPLEMHQELETSSGTVGPVALGTLIHESRLSQAADPRDKVFGMLAILPDCISNRITPRYDSPVLAVWTSFARICFEQEGNLALLARASGRLVDAGSWIQGLPSWAFDLTDQLEEVEIAEDPNGCYLPSDFFDRLRRHFSQESAECFAADEGMPSLFSFSDDGQHLICKAIFVDFVSAVTLHEGNDIDPIVVEEAQTAALPPPRRDLKSAKRSLGRVLHLSSKWKPSSHPTLFDIPWPGVVTEDLSGTHLGFQDDRDKASKMAEDEAFARGEPVSWAACFRNSEHTLAPIFVYLMPYADFELHGIPLREYFSTDKATSPPPEVFDHLASIHIKKDRHYRRLFRTRKGRIGTLVRGGRPGDMIAVVGGCDFPLVLRPRGKEYVIVDNCFVDGLMDGQAAEMVARGEANIDEISIC